ncbi:hypothetical protein FRC14_008239 [Serendipita sp. 396]|nr:hypothetical protein FRC14_008239 [Serendipita sp. 396]
MDRPELTLGTTSTVSSNRSLETIHIVYVHGFQGDHTTFQSFPSDLHYYLLPHIPNLQSWIYPTYKSAKPLSFAVKNFLMWLGSLPEGHIIISGHSMGGLLVAEAATDRSDVARRIIGMIAFDTPYLGMHPHVVVSGIASLFQKKEEPNKSGGSSERPKTPSFAMEKGMPAPSAQGLPSEKALNDDQKINFVSSIDAYPEGTASPTLSISPPHSPGAGMFHSYHPPSPSSSKLSVGGKSTQSVTSSMISSTLSFFQKHPNERFMRFLNKHSDAPFQAMTRWVVQYFEFGFAMFDYPELLERYRKLEKWEGDWVNYWSVTVPKQSDTLEVQRTRSLKDDASMTEEEGEDWTRPPTPKKIVRMSGPATSSKTYEQGFDAMMKQAMKKDEKRKEKEELKRFEMEQKERLRVAKEEEKERRKEEERQEKERIRALQEQEKERKKREKEQARAGKSKEEYPTTPQISIEESQDQEEESLYTDSGSTRGTVPVAQENTSRDGQERTVSSRPVSPTPSNKSSRPPSPDQVDPHHFITLPSNSKHTGLCKNRWLKVPIAGVEDEVAAHCGLFFRHQNLEYDQFVERVGKLVRSWVE